MKTDLPRPRPLGWMAKAIELAGAGESGAVAAMMALLLGMRASEIVTRVVRDLDDDGQILWIPRRRVRDARCTRWSTS
jgi:hypothetical protein